MSASPFYQSIEAVFKGWTALQLAVTHSFGGSQSREKAVWLIGATEQWFKENSDIDSYELEDFLAEIMSAEFNSVVDDDSLAEVSTKICRFYDLIRQGRLDELQVKLGALKTAADVSSSQLQAGSDEDDDDELDVTEQNITNHINALELQQETADGSTQSGTDNSSSQTEDASQNTTTEEDDGWTVVTNKTSRKKR